MKEKLTFFMALSTFLAMIFGCTEAKKEPEWTKAKVLTENLEAPSAITLDDKFIYFVTGGHLASLKAGTSGLWKMPITGGLPTLLVKGYQKDERTVFLPDTFVIATDEKFVYFVADGIYKVLKDGGEPEKITNGKPTEMVLDEENIYWHDYVGEGMKATPAYSVSKKGGEVKTLTDAATILDIAVDKEFFYWAQPDGIYKKAKSGGEKILIIAPKKDGRITEMITDQNSIYFLDEDKLFMIPKVGDALVQIISGVNYVHKFFVDDKNVYFVKNEGSLGTSINKVSKNGGEVTKIDSGYIKSYAVGKDKVYVTNISKVCELEK